MPELVPSLAPQAERLRRFAERTIAEGPVGIQPVIIAGNLTPLEYGDEPLGWVISGQRAAVVGEHSHVGVRVISGLAIVEGLLVVATASPQRLLLQLNRAASTVLAADALGLANTAGPVVPPVRRVFDTDVNSTLGTTVMAFNLLLNTTLYVPLGGWVLSPTDALWLLASNANESVDVTMWGKVYTDVA